MAFNNNSICKISNLCKVHCFLTHVFQLIKEFYKEVYHGRYGGDVSGRLLNSTYHGNDTNAGQLDGGISEGMLTFLWSLTTTMFLPGGMIGAFSAGFLADKLGRYMPLYSYMSNMLLVHYIIYLCAA